MSAAQAPVSIELECTATVTLNQKLQQGQHMFFYSVQLQDEVVVDNKGRRYVAKISPEAIEYAGELERKVDWKGSVLTYKESIYGTISRTSGQLVEGHLAKEVGNTLASPIRTELAGTCRPVAPKF